MDLVLALGMVLRNCDVNGWLRMTSLAASLGDDALARILKMPRWRGCAHVRWENRFLGWESVMEMDLEEIQWRRMAGAVGTLRCGWDPLAMSVVRKRL